MNLDLKKEDAKVLKNVIAFIKDRCKMDITGQEYFAMTHVFERQLQISEMILNYEEAPVVEIKEEKKKK